MPSFPFTHIQIANVKKGLAKPMVSVDVLKRKKIAPTLTVKGFVIHCSTSLTSANVSKFDWTNALIDSAIVSALTFFSTLGGGSVAGLNLLVALKAASVAACAQFFVFLALKRGIVQNNP
jgi:hypothetical protein